jgi:hypothetical protein
MITLVTGLWDIGRSSLNEGWNRSFDFYLQRFDELLRIDCNFIIFGDEELEKFVLQRRDMSKTIFIKRDINWFKQNEYYNKIQEIRTNPNWYNQVGWLSQSTQAKLEMYNPLVMSKMFLLHDALLLDTFNSEKLYWIDAGLTNTVNLGYFTHDKVLDKIDKFYDKFTFVCFPYEAETEVHGFDYKKMCDYSKTKTEFVCRGGFFGGDRHSIIKMNQLYYELLIDTLKNNLMGTEESLFTILTYQHPSLIDYFKIEFDGLMYRFFEFIKNYTEPKIIHSSDIGLYVITFNSPKQFETLINSMLSYDSDFIYKTEKYLLNNSTDDTTTDEYIKLCEKYNFKHIKKNNIGITGGRQFIAEHFNNQNHLNYYFFFEDDMFFVDNQPQTCKNGFNRYVDNLLSKTLNIIKKENFDFLKLNFTEFFGSHQTQWAWYNVPQDFRQNHWPNNPNLPTSGYDENAPNIEFKHIKSLNGLPYVSGEIYLSNWPIILSKEGNYKCYIKEKFTYPYEQTLMSHNYQEMIKGNLNPGLLLITPTEHNRFDFYPAELRKEC